VKKLIVTIAVLASFLLPTQAFAKDYNYPLVDIEYVVNADSTVDVTERMTFNFEGTFNYVHKVILKRGTSAITDVKVFDEETGKELRFSSQRLDETDSSSWGSYCVLSRGTDSVDVYWYYNLTDTTHTWDIKYKLHGAISFLSDKDELYWDAIGNGYEKNINEAKVTVRIPEGANINELQFASYGNESASGRIIDSQTFVFDEYNLSPKEVFTVAAGWPKGLVSQSDFWRDWFRLKTYWIIGIVSTLLLIVLTVFIRKRDKRGKGVIVPQYEPPRGLTPAMAEVVESGATTSWPATVIDLAIRGYLTIKKEKEKKAYTITRTEKETSELKNYESEFLETIFHKNQVFDMSKRPGLIEARFISKGIKKAFILLLKETEEETKAFLRRPSRKPWNSKKMTQSVRFIITFALEIALAVLFVISLIYFLDVMIFVSYLVVLFIGWAVYMHFRVEWTEQGKILREEILGFKLYLKTAEKYRMQNLTPEIFEEYLPYAMIFGVEKKWVQAFEGMNIPNPSWYTTYAVSGQSDYSGFSSIGFSNSFSSAFISATGISSGSGGSGSGGSTGGGGGGGGASAG